jgi:hypothetical protein
VTIITGKRALLLAAIEVPPYGWHQVPREWLLCGRAIKWARELPTPPAGQAWGEPTCHQMIWVKMISDNGRPLLRVSRGPWVAVTEVHVSLDRALDVIEHPHAVLGDDRQWQRVDDEDMHGWRLPPLWQNDRGRFVADTLIRTYGRSHVSRLLYAVPPLPDRAWDADIREPLL